jgi:hypothetical protein
VAFAILNHANLLLSTGQFHCAAVVPPGVEAKNDDGKYGEDNNEDADHHGAANDQPSVGGRILEKH